MPRVARKRFPVKPFLSTASLQWRLNIWIMISANTNHRELMKAEPSRLIRHKLAANVEHLIVKEVKSKNQFLS